MCVCVSQKVTNGKKHSPFEKKSFPQDYPKVTDT